MQNWKFYNIKTIRAVLFIFLLFSMVRAQDSPLQADQNYQFALQLEKKGMFDLAAHQFKEYAETYPTSVRAPEALLKAGQNYGKADSLGKAEQAFLSLILKYPETDFIDQAQYNRADLMAKTGEYLNAALAFERVKILTPESSLIPEAQLQACRQYQKANEHQKAIDAAFYIIENERTHPMQLQARYLIAKSKQAQGQFEEAIASLNNISSDNIKDDFAVQVNILKSRIMKKLGRFAQADSLMRHLIKAPHSNETLGPIAFELSNTLQGQNNYAESNRIVNDALSKVDEPWQTKLYLVQGDNYYALGQYENALESYREIDLANMEELKTGTYFRLAKTNKELNNVDKAIEQYSLVCQDSSSEKAYIRHKSFIERGQLLAANGKGRDAVFDLQRALNRTTKPALKCELLYAIGQIQHIYLDDYAGARQRYGSISGIAPGDQLVDDAQYQIAQTFEDQKRYDLALSEYQRCLELYPGGDHHSDIVQRIYRLQHFAPPSAHHANNAFTKILSENLSGGSQPQTVLQWAEKQMNVFHDYQQALDLLRKAEYMDLGEELDKTKLLYYKTACHYYLMEKWLYEKRPEKSAAHRDSVLAISAKFDQQFTVNKYSQKSKYKAVMAQLSTFTLSKKKIEFLENAVSSFQSGVEIDSLLNQLRFTLAIELLKTAENDTSAKDFFRRADQILNTVIKTSDVGELHAEALFRRAVLMEKTGRRDSSIALLLDLATLPVHTKKVQATYLLARFTEKSGQLKKALPLYDKVYQDYFYAVWAQRAQFRAIDLLLQLDRVQEAEQRMKKMRKTMLPENMRVFYDEISDEENVWLWAQLVKRTQTPQHAISAYRQYLELGKDTSHRAQALFNIGQLANEINDIDVSVGHFQECADQFPNDSLGIHARYKTADIFFERGMYEKAVSGYNAIIDKLSGDLQKQALYHAIISEYRLGHLSRANRKAEEYKNKYKDRDAEARFLYEEGVLYIAEKEFNRAEKTLKRLSNKYDDIPQGGRGNLGLARLYVTLNKTEEALERLTDITENYNDPEIVATAFVNLADFYYENRQLENCIGACKNVMKLQQKGSLRAQAMDLLINAYDDFNMRDRAIAIERQYIEEYPNDPSLLRRKIRIGIFLYNLKEYDRAIQHFASIQPLLSAEQETEVQYWIAKSYSDAGMTEKAIIEFLKVRFACKPTKLPWGATALYEAGQGYRKLGNLEKAREMFEMVVNERGTSDNIGRAANAKMKEVEEEIAKTS